MNAAPSMFPTGRIQDREILDCWKQIASELNRSIRTVQRWERDLGLPVHRMPGGPSTPVFAFKDEVHIWLSKAAVQLQISHEIPEKESVGKIIASLPKFFIENSGKTSCQRCGSAMQHIHGRFWLHGTNNKWKVAFPFCPACEPELLTRTLQRITDSS